MKHIIDPAFDPLQDLQDCKECIVRLQHQMAELQSNFHRLVQAHNHHAELLRQVVTQNTEILHQLAQQQAQNLQRKIND